MGLNHIIEFQSYLDFTGHTWLYDEMSYGSGISKTPNSGSYYIGWSPKYKYELTDDLGKIQIVSSNWTLPFYLKIDRQFFSNIESDNTVAKDLHNFISHFLDCLEHIFLQINVMKFTLDGRGIIISNPIEATPRRLNYTPKQINLNEIFNEYSLMGETGHTDIVCMLAAEPGSLNVSWQFLIDSIASFESGHYKGCLIYACTAIELEVGPIVREWLQGSTSTGASDYIDRTLTEMGNPMKFEVFFKHEEPRGLSLLSEDQRNILLQALKRINSIRNKVIHSGYEVTFVEATEAIRMAGILLRVLWGYKNKEIFKEYGIIGIFEEFEENIKKLEI